MSLETGQGPSHPRGWCGWVNLDSGSFLGFPVSEFWAVLTLQLPPSFQGQVFGNWLDFNSINVTSTLPGHFTKILDIFKVPYSQTIPLDRTHLFDSLAWRTVEKGKNLGCFLSPTSWLWDLGRVTWLLPIMFPNMKWNNICPTGWP